jgi:60 kDa SS-A/Ro ribonucleoprotein
VKLNVVRMVSDGFAVAEPSDAGMIDVVGFDTVAAAVVADFARR